MSEDQTDTPSLTRRIYTVAREAGLAIFRWLGSHFRWLGSKWFSNFITLIAVIVAVASLLYTNRNQERALDIQQNLQQENNNLAREMNTDNMWVDYMELAIQYPQFADGTDYVRLSELERIQYSWFVERLLYTGESILKFAGGNQAWRSVFETEASKHRSLFENHPRFLPEYYCDYDRIMRDIIAKGSRAASARNRQCRRDDEVSVE